MAGAGDARHRARPVSGGVVARAVVMAAAARPHRRRDRFCHCRRRGAGAVGPVAYAGVARGPEPARSRQRAAASSGDRDRGRTRRQREGPLFAGAVERPCRARAAGGARAQSRQAFAARRLARSLRGARLGAARLHRHIFCRRRRALEARRRGVRLAGRGAAGEFPGRCLGGAAALHRQAAAGAARHSSRRRHGGGAGAGRRTLRRAGQFDADRALDRQRQPRHFRQWRRHAVEGSGAGAGRHRGASLYDRRHRHGDVARRRRRSHLAVQRHSRQSADHHAHQGSAGAEPRLVAAVLPDRGRLRRDQSRSDFRAEGRSGRARR